MRTPKRLPKIMPTVYPCELEICPQCEGPLVERPYLNGLKAVQTLQEVLTIAFRPKRCADLHCPGRLVNWPSAQWQQVAPWHGTLDQSLPRARSRVQGKDEVDEWVKSGAGDARDSSRNDED